MLRLVVWLAVLVLGAGAAHAEGGSPGAPIELQWLKVGADIIATVGMPGVILGLLYLIKLQREELRDERTFSRKLQDERAAIASASADRLATVSVSGSNAIGANTTAMATLAERSQTNIDLIRPLQAGLDRLVARIDELATKVGTGHRA